MYEALSVIFGIYQQFQEKLTITESYTHQGWGTIVILKKKPYLTLN